MGVQFEWHSNDASWAPTVPVRPGPSRRNRAMGLALVLIVVATAGVVLWRREAGLHAVRADLQRQVDLTLFALRAGDEAAFLASFDGRDILWLDYQYASLQREAAWYQAHGWLHPRVANVQLDADEAAAVMIWPTDPVRRATWHFRRRDDVWQQTAPPNAWWGEIQEIETDHVTLRVYAPDLEAARQLAPELDRMVADLSATYPAAQSARAGTQRLILRVWPHGTLDGAMANPETPIIPSPSSGLEVRTAIERTDDLRSRARLALAFAVLVRAREHALPVTKHWWLLESLAAYYAGDPGDPAVVRAGLADGSYLQLLDMAADSADPRDAPGQSLTADRVRPLAYTLGRLLVSRYGDQLGALVAALASRSSSWEELQRTLGVSRAELETAWGSELARSCAAYPSP